MVNKFVIALAAAATLMALLVAAPRLVGTNSQGSGSSGQFKLEYDRMSDSGSNESLVVNNDGSATLSQGSRVQTIQITSDKLTELRSLVLDTGFMNIKSPSQPETNHALKAETGDTTQVVTWSSLNDTQSSNAPPIVIRIQQLLDETIASAQPQSR